MSQRLRGQEATLRIAVDGQLQKGSFVKVKDFTVTPRQDIMETDYTGEDETDLDFQHHGFDLSFSVDMADRSTHDLLSTIVQRELDHLNHPAISITVHYAFREGAQVGSNLIELYHENLILKQGDMGAGGRKEYLAIKYEAKCKKRSVLQAA